MTDGEKEEEGKRGGSEGEKAGTRHTAESVRGIGWRWWWWWEAIVPAGREQSSDIIKL